MWHQHHLCASQCQNAADLRELIIVANDDADFARTDVENGNVAAALVVKPLVARQMQLSLLADIAVWTDQNLRVVDDVAFLFAHAGAEHQAMAFGDAHQG